ncbi:MAG: lipid-A-disaccharide synthase [Candidatus Omnitrophica bacterium]|nr:lipid-A-disaccharide synthase [Candidatus Omnitrophota bacterium]
MPAESKKFVIIAGEASGDQHAADLVKAIKHLNPSCSFSGLGGAHMKKAGVDIHEDLTRLAIVGFTEVLKHYRLLKSIFNQTLDKIQAIQPDAVILVDYPGFNLRLAKELKKKNIKVFFYISPQVWAWKENRIQHIKKYVDELFVFFPFEKDLYAKHGMNVHFIGHPLVDQVVTRTSKTQFLKTAGLYDYKLTVGLLPGSREREIDTLLPQMIQASNILYKKFPSMQFLIMKASTIARAQIDDYTQAANFPVKVIEENVYEGIHACDLCIVTSGTATLETAILQKPMVVIYKTSFLTYLLAKLFIKIPYIGLVNVVAGGKIVPECVQNQASPENIAKTLEGIFTDEIKIAEIKSNLHKVKELLGEGGASRRAAELMLELLN